MKKWILAPLAALAMSGCGGNLGALFPVASDSYRVNLSNLGYEVDQQGLITIPSVEAQVTVRAGAPDLVEISYVGTLLNGRGEPVLVRLDEDAEEEGAVLTDEEGRIYGTLTSYVPGGYFCRTAAGAIDPALNECPVSQREFATRNRALVIPGAALIPGTWARAHQLLGIPAGWSVEMEYTARTAAGQQLRWTQRYQLRLPAGG